MSIRTLESAITDEARRYFNNRTLRVKDLMEWSSALIKPVPGEVVAKLPLNGVYVAIKSEHDKRPAACGPTQCIPHPDVYIAAGQCTPQQQGQNDKPI